MRQPIPLHSRQTIVKHPPYGLYLDPHGEQHHWTAVDARFLLGLTTALGGLGAILLIAAR
jgi:hypothetical protein